MTAAQEKILVIKLGALGDFIAALGAMRAIRNYHPDAEITLMTTSPYVSLARESGYFDQIIVDSRPKLFQLMSWFDLKKRLNDPKFARVYDLQNNDRTAIYYSLMMPKPEWVGATKGASHYYDDPERTSGKALHGLRLLLENAGVGNIGTDRLEWMRGDTAQFDLPENAVLVVPGAAPSRPEKIWPTPHYIELCRLLIDHGKTPVLLGGEAEKTICTMISDACSGAVNYCGKTLVFDLPTLARQVIGAVGNDTGPMHVIGPTGCPALVLFSPSSNPVRHAPEGENVRTLQADPFSSLSPQDVFETLSSMLAPSPA